MDLKTNRAASFSGSSFVSALKHHTQHKPKSHLAFQGGIFAHASARAPKTMNTITALILTSALALPAFAATYPGKTRPGKATTQNSGDKHTLQNDVLSATWTTKDGTLTGATFTNKQSGETFSPQGELFAIATQPQQQDPERIYLAIRKTGTHLLPSISNDGKNWETLTSISLAEYPAQLATIRIGKTSSQGQNQDYVDAGETGISEIQQVRILSKDGKVCDITSKPEEIFKSKRPGTELEIANEQLSITAAANSFAFAEYSAPSTDWSIISCQIKKGTDKGLSWGPGITLVFKDNTTAIVNIRSKGQFTIRSPKGEQLINKTPRPALDCNLSSSEFTLTGPVKASAGKDGQTLTATLKHEASGLHVRWMAELRDGSNYIRQSHTLATTKPLTIHGLQFTSGRASGASQVGTVPGSPVASNSLFFGVEMPFTANYFSDDTFRSGFPCTLPMDKDSRYTFTAVTGTYPQDQLRRAFLYYMERERSTPYHQLLHYNCWYDLGLNPTRETFTKVIEDYHRELTKERGVTVDSFVMDDGWDDFHVGLWEYNRKKFPNGFDEVSAAARKADSKLGVWISPLGGYSGANERTAHAKKMGLIQDTMDLSQPGYYQWFYEKCLGFMKDHGVNYYKWDKAGSGVSPHFMSLIRCGSELKEHDPKLFINVTVGTWPSPFWLNHIDCTWRTGTGDVAWMGVGDEREQWLTFRDWGCYEKFVKPAPLYPLNSVMHHGLVHGRHFQAAKVSKAGSEFKNAARSYFGTGANLLELYLTPDMMTESAWDQVAEAAKWAKKNESILVDTHWVGGNPLDLTIYGWASWSPEKSIITLRNSSDKEVTKVFDLTKELEIPKGFATTFKAKNAYPDQNFPEDWVSGELAFTLQPFEVLVLELTPVK
ncbi:hypothetical protein Rhal01_02088 [Rubritalea halochordaticola]|uniref:Enterotoxin n=2 Tax=Rubritalea halochordaticola TaxID=714537 RepID=A0ABP9V5K6_9BACT